MWSVVGPLAPYCLRTSNVAAGAVEMAAMAFLYTSIMKSGDNLIPPLEADVSDGTGAFMEAKSH